MGYNASSGVVSATSVGVADVGAALFSNSTDVATLCTHGNINKWSKHKPVRGGTQAEITTWIWSTGSTGVGAPTGSNPLWGLLVPTNTAQQLGTSGAFRYLKPLAVRASGAKTGGNVYNYTYLAPRLGTDWMRLTDFAGYEANAPEPWSANVYGANPHPQGSYLTINAFGTSEVTFGFGKPANASIGFSDLFGHAHYRFVVEIYKDESDVKSNDGKVPVAILVSKDAVSSSLYGTAMTIRVSRLQNLLGLSGGGRFLAVLGINGVPGSIQFPAEESVTVNGSIKKLGYYVFNSVTQFNYFGEGYGSIPPWHGDSSKLFICDCEITAYSNLTIQILGFAASNSTSYMEDPTNPWSTDNRPRFKTTVTNNGSKDVQLNPGTSTTSNLDRPIFRIKARGSYNTSNKDYPTMCEDAYNSKWRTLNVSNQPGMGGNAFNIAKSGGSATVYFQTPESLLPSGTTNGFTIEASTDGGATWVITGSFSGTFICNYVS